MFARLAAALLLPLALTSCLLSPGKFVSTLRIDADRSFAFTYVGEVYATDAAKALPEGMSTKTGGDDVKDPAKQKAESEAKNRALAAALSKEAGYRRVTYVGGGKFLIDYAVTGVLSHAFVWPYNIDAEVIIPFIAIELRQGDIVRMKAPGFANDDGKGMPQMPGMSGGDGAAASKLDGVFTLDTDADIVSQNNEDGVVPAAARKTIRWQATPQTRAAPTAVLRLRP